MTHLIEVIAFLGAANLNALSTPIVPRKPSFVYGQTGVEWVRLDAGPGDNSHALIFASAAYRQRYSPGVTAKVYAAGATGLRDLASLLDVPLRKVGATEDSDVRPRMADINRDQYGGCIETPNGQKIEAGFDNFVAAQIVLSGNPSPLGPVTNELRALSVVLPDTLSFLDFERLLQHEARLVSLVHWARSEIGKCHLAKIGVPLQTALRRTAYRYGSVTPAFLAEEIWIFRPRQDGDRLLRLIERIILKHLKLPE